MHNKVRVWLLLTGTLTTLLLPAQTVNEIEARRVRAERRQRAQEEFTRMRAWPHGSIPAGARLQALRDMERMPKAATASGWTLIGPQPTLSLAETTGTGTGTGAPYTAGRVAAVAVDPRDPNTAYTGASGGGVWKTTDGGQTWTPLTDNQPSLATGSIAIAPSNSNIVYVGTGEQNNSGDSYYGAGVLKSTDGGATWTQQAGPFVGLFSTSRVTGGGARIGALAVHPQNPDNVLAGVSLPAASASGIYRTTDGGSTWNQVLSGAVGTDVVFNPADPTIVYAALGTSGGNARNGVYKSTDGGATFALAGAGTGANNIPTSGGRITLAIAASSPNTIYAGVAQNTGTTLLGLYKSTDGAQTWTRLPAPDYCNPQCSYDNIVRVSPTNPNLLVAAGLPPYRSTDGGNTWANIAVGSDGLVTHTDHHGMAFSGDGRVLYVGNDGGVWRSSNITTTNPGAIVWSNLNSTLAITEFSSNVSIDPTDPRNAHAGTQDNGTLTYRGNLAWEQSVGGDGGMTAIDFAIPSIWYGTTTAVTLYKMSGVTSLDSCINAPFVPCFEVLYNGINLTDRFMFYSRIVMNPSNPLWLYFGSQRVYESYDGEGTWNLLSPDMTAGSSVISAIGVSPAAPRTVAVGTSDAKLQVNSNAGPGGFNDWVDRTAGLPPRAVTQVTFDPVSPTTLYVAVSGFYLGSSGPPTDHGGHIFKTTDLGQTWTDISANLPNIPVNDVQPDPDLPGTLYAATDIGVFVSSDGGQNWANMSTGLPKVLVQSLNLHRASRTLRAVTYGRSMWDLSVPLPGVSRAPYIAVVGPSTIAGPNPVLITLSGSNFTSASVVRWNGVDRTPTFVDANTLRITLGGSDITKTGRGTIAVFNPSAGGGLSNLVNVPVGPPPSFDLSGLASAASPSVAGPLVPGSIASITGSNLAPETAVAAPGQVPYTLGGVTVEVLGFVAPLFSVSPTQIKFQVPWELEGFREAIIRVVNGTMSNSPIVVPVAIAAPSLFSMDGTGTGQGAITIAGTGTIAAPAGAVAGSRPARRGEIVEIYATGLGPVSRTQGDGAVKTPTPISISQFPIVTIGGVTANVLFSGLTPGAVGLYQVDVTIPDSVTPGNAVPVVFTMQGATSNTVTMAVQ